VDLKTIEQNWTAASGKAVVNGKFDYFSAVCWFFGKNVYDKVRKLVRKWSSDQLGQLQPFVPVFPQECMGQLALFGPT
jgi:hypothetical protein